MSEEWTVVSKGKGRARRDRGCSGPAPRSSLSPAGGNRPARRSRQSSPGGDGEDDADQEQDTEVEAPAEVLPGWGGGGGRAGGGSMNGRLGGQRKKRQWTERTPEEKVDSLRRGVLEAKKVAGASAFWASLRLAFAAASAAVDGDDSDAEHDGGHGGSGAVQNSSCHANGQAGSCHAGSQASRDADDTQRQNGSAPLHEGLQEPAQRQNSHTSGGSAEGVSAERPASSMSMDRPVGNCSGGSPTAMATSPKAADAEADTAASPAAQQLAGAAEAVVNGHPSPTRRWRWTGVDQLVVYGLGSFESGPVPRHQLALVLLLMDALGSRLRQPPQLFDPCFTKVDKMLIQQLGCEVILQNEHGRRVFDGGADTANGAAASGRAPSNDDSDAGGFGLVYLAHCKPELANNLLNANWEPERLGCFAVIGNSMNACVDTWRLPSMRRTFKERPSRVLSAVAASAISETSIPEGGYLVVGAFNDVYFHVFTDPQVAVRPNAAPPEHD